MSNANGMSIVKIISIEFGNPDIKVDSRKQRRENSFSQFYFPISFALGGEKLSP
jgi:hypothetical protein